MPFQRILLVHPPSGAEWRGLVPHIGQAYLAQSLENQGLEYDVLDMNVAYRLQHLLRKIRQFQPDLLGMSLISIEYKSFYKLLIEVKNMTAGSRLWWAAPTLRKIVDGLRYKQA